MTAIPEGVEMAQDVVALSEASNDQDASLSSAISLPSHEAKGHNVQSNEQATLSRLVPEGVGNAAHNIQAPSSEIGSDAIEVDFNVSAKRLPC
jgi:hypothetical protein